MIYTQAVNGFYSHSMDVLLLYHLSLSSLHLSSVGTLVIFITTLNCVSKRSRFSTKGPELCAFAFCVAYYYRCGRFQWIVR